MTFYLIIAVVIVMIDVVWRPGQSMPRRRALAWVIFGGLGVVGSIRSPSVGGDTPQYFEFFTVIGSLDWGDRRELRYEPGYFYLNKAVYLFSHDPQVFIAVTTLFILGVFAWFVGSYSRNVALSALFFIFLQGYAFALMALRQSLAIAVILLFVPQLTRGNRLGFAVGVALAAQFHNTAWVALVLIPLAELRFGVMSVVLLLVSSGVLLISNRLLLEYAATGAGQYSDYLITHAEGEGKLGVLLMALIYAVYIAFVAWFKRNPEVSYSSDERADNVLLQASWLLLPMLALAYGSNTFLRMANYFLPFLIVVIPSTLESIRCGSRRRLWSYVTVSLAVAYFVVMTGFRPEWYRVTPFTSPFFS